jgi:putative ABC transport system permease protein
LASQLFKSLSFEKGTKYLWIFAPFASPRQTKTMFRHILRLAWRNIGRNKTYSVVNVLGLALSICSCICIYLLVSFEFSFDNWHADGSRIYRVMGEVVQSTGEKDRFIVLPPAVLHYGRGRFTGLDGFAGVIPYPAAIAVPVAGGPARQFGSGLPGTRMSCSVLAEQQYFDIFHYDWLAGDPSRALEAPFTVVLTAARARQYFGPEAPEKLIGRQVIYNDSLKVTVSGIVADWEMPTDLPFTDFLSVGTIPGSVLGGWMRPDMTAYIFVKLSQGMAAKSIEREMAAIIRDHADARARLSLSLEPLTAMHFDSDLIENPIRTAHRPTLYGLVAIGLFILILAIINFVNLSTACYLQRTREVGLRKVLGSSKGGLLVQFLVESFLLVATAGVIAAAMVNPVLTWFHDYIPNGLVVPVWKMLLFMTLLVVGTTLSAGLYPAKMASAVLPVTGLRGAGGEKGGEKWFLRRGLIVFQFAISLVFIIGSIVITEQLNYTRTKDLGFTADAIVNIDIPGGDSLIRLKTLERQLKALPGVANATRQWLSPMAENARGMKVKFKGDEMQITQVAGDENYIPLYGIRLLAGRNLYPADSVHELVINETLSRKMGSREPTESLGKMLYWNDKPYPVVGVVADFHTQSLHDPITPLCIINRGDREWNLAVKLASKGESAGAVRGTLERIGRVWKEAYPAGVFGYHFYDESLALLYEKDRRAATLVHVSTAIAVFISCIGLFGLTLFTTQKRAREIGIRKLLGASVGRIVVLLCRDIVILVGIAFAVASPVALWLASRWLGGFAYHIEIGGGIFLMAGSSAVAIALLTVSVQTLKAARANPVEALHQG